MILSPHSQKDDGVHGGETLLRQLQSLLNAVPNKYQITGPSLISEDFQIFKEKKALHILGKLTDVHPSVGLPFKEIIIKKRIVSPGNFDTVSEEFFSHKAAIDIWRNPFNLNVGIELYLFSFDAAKIATLCEILIQNDIDAIDIIFGFPGLDEDPAAKLIEGLKLFCLKPVLKNPKIKLKNFPFCFIPVEKYKYLYRHIIESLKGNVLYQRHIIQELKVKKPLFFEVCRKCRCKIPCYAYTQVRQFPAYKPFLAPKSQSTAVFVGGSLSGDDRHEDSTIVYVSPAEQGDMSMAILEGFENILLIDSYFYSKFPCTTFEVLLALEQGINVFGSSSIGALRAVELDTYGMRGTGYVYEYLKKRRIKPYHIVAQTYNEDDTPLSIPQTNIIYFLECALNQGLITRDDFDICMLVADDIHFTALSFKYFFKQLKSRGELLPETVSELERYCFNSSEESFNIKRKDAISLLADFRNMLDTAGPEHSLNTFQRAREKYLKILYSKYRCHFDLALPGNWRTPVFLDKHEGNTAYNTRDHRERLTSDTLALAEKFFEGLDVIIADTTKYDSANNFVINIFFIPFYFLERNLSSATGNGDIFTEALVSAYMELLERIPLYAFNVNPLKEEEVPGEIVPLEALPQYYNWDVPEQAKRATAEEWGYVKMTELLTGKDVYVSRLAVMSSSEGSASGNSLPEAILYAIYELIERDVSRTYDSISDEFKGALILNKDSITDKRSRILFESLEEKGCRVILYNFMNLYELPCVRCEVYDLNSRMRRNGGTAVNADMNLTIFRSLSEAYMGYIIDFMGVRDDFRSTFEFEKNRHALFKKKQPLFRQNKNADKIIWPSLSFDSVRGELDFVIGRLEAAGVKEIITADVSPLDKFNLKAVKAIIPRLDIVFIKPYKPSFLYEAKLRQTEFIIKCWANRETDL